MKRCKLITGIIISCLFGGLVGGPIDYNGSSEERFRLFIVPEFIGFISVGFLIYYARSKKNENG